MTPRQLKTGYYALEGLNAFATTYYFNYLFFFMKSRYGFSDAGNLWLSALFGLVYIPGSLLGGRVAQRHGYFFALRLGFAGMALGLGLGWVGDTAAAQCCAVPICALSMCFIWPTLEALVSEGESRAGLQRCVGIYNVVWAGGSAVGYFVGGALLDRLGLLSLFWLPIGVHLTQLALTGWLDRQQRRVEPSVASAVPEETAEAHPRPANLSMSPAAFMRVAWVANPFAYVAINTAVTVMPMLAERLNLSLAWVGVFCSLWFFARLAAFVGLWLWPGWHYRFRWLFTAYLALVASFLTLLLASQLWLVIVAQIVFGLAIGMTYYSSLFYSMDVGTTKGEHGGFHEAAIGLGIFGGPFVGAVATTFVPRYAHSSAWAVGAVLVVGAGLILWVRQRRAADAP